MLDSDVSDDEDVVQPPKRRSARAVSGEAVRGAGFGARPRKLKMRDFGCPLPHPDQLHRGDNGTRQLVLLETLKALELASPTARYHVLARQNLLRWKLGAETGAPRKLSRAQVAAAGTGSWCRVVVLPGDWGVVTLEMTRRYGMTFASLNMANAYGPGGGYTDGMVAQEENMFRRTDCHFALGPEDMESHRCEYVPEHTDLLNAVDGRVYLDVERPRVCIRGAEDRTRRDLGYAWLPDDEIFPFYELRAAALDLRDGSRFDPAETAKRVGAQLDTLIEHGVRHAVLSAFGCGAFMNPAHRVAAIYRKELEARAASFDVVAFGVFHAGYGPNNYEPFVQAFADWPGQEDAATKSEPSAPRSK